MGIRRRDIASATVVAAAAATVVAAAMPARAQPKNESTWDLIKRTGKVRMGVFEYPPYFLRDKASGEWVGAMVEMGKDIAKELKVKFVPVEVGGFAEAVLSLQAGKVDMNFGLQATPLRATAIDFAGPIYWIEWVTVNNPKFKAKVWADYNKPERQGRRHDRHVGLAAAEQDGAQGHQDRDAGHLRRWRSRSRRAAPTPSPPRCWPAWS